MGARGHHWLLKIWVVPAFAVSLTTIDRKEAIIYSSNRNTTTIYDIGKIEKIFAEMNDLETGFMKRPVPTTGQKCMVILFTREYNWMITECFHMLRI